MIGHFSQGAAAVVVATGFCGCPRPAPISPESSGNRKMLKVRKVRQDPWVRLFDGGDAKRWRVLQGKATVQNGAMVLDGRDEDVTILAKGVKLKNGTVEVAVRRRAGARNVGPYTVAVRLLLSVRMPVKIKWRSIYFVCRPEHVEACRASDRRQRPPPEIKANVRRGPQPEVWRFVMNEGTIDCYRSGKLVLRYKDRSPAGGTIALTASKCAVEVLEVKYKP